MPRFGKKSKAVLATCHPDLQALMNEVIKVFDFSALSGSRTKDEQAELVRRGVSKCLDSKHVNNPSLAIDIAPYPIDWNDTKRFYYLAGFIMMKAKDMGIKLRWGGDWDSDTEVKDQNFFDLGHFELKE